MRIDTDAAFEVLERVVATRLSPAEGISRVIAVCRDSFEHPDWGRLEAIDWNQDGLRLAAWIRGVVEASRPPFDVRGVWFGLSNVSEGDAVSLDMYFSGSASFDRDGKLAWADEADYRPDGAFLGSTALAELYGIAYETEDSLGNDAEWALGLAFGGLLVASSLRDVTPALLRSEAERSAWSSVGTAGTSSTWVP